jgi:hypothetical protein
MLQLKLTYQVELKNLKLSLNRSLVFEYRWADKIEFYLVIESSVKYLEQKGKAYGSFLNF